MKITKWTVDKQEGIGGTSGHFTTFSAGFCLGKELSQPCCDTFLLAVNSEAVLSDPNLSATLDQVLHVPFDHVQMLLDVVEVLHSLVCSHAACVALVLGWADLFQGLVKGVPAVPKRTCTLQAGEPPMDKKKQSYRNWLPKHRIIYSAMGFNAK